MNRLHVGKLRTSDLYALLPRSSPSGNGLVPGNARARSGEHERAIHAPGHRKPSVSAPPRSTRRAGRTATRIRPETPGEDGRGRRRHGTHCNARCVTRAPPGRRQGRNHPGRTAGPVRAQGPGGGPGRRTRAGGGPGRQVRAEVGPGAHERPDAGVGGGSRGRNLRVGREAQSGRSGEKAAAGGRAGRVKLPCQVSGAGPARRTPVGGVAWRRVSRRGRSHRGRSCRGTRGTSRPRPPARRGWRRPRPPARPRWRRSWRRCAGPARWSRRGGR